MKRDRFMVYDERGQMVLETVDVERVKALLSRMRNGGFSRAVVRFVVEGAPIIAEDT